MSLDLRKMQILEAIIDDYITNGIPVGSRTIARRTDVNVSPATIRNEMYDLKEMGLLEQLHASAGSIPSDKAYRLYVDSIMRRSQLNEDESRYIKEHLSNRVDDASSVIKQAARALSEMTSYISMVLPPQMNAVRLRRIQLMHVRTGVALLIIIADVGLVRDTTINVPEDITPQMLERISNMLSAKLTGRRLRDISERLIIEMLNELGERKEFLNVVHSLMEAINEPSANALRSLELSGTTNILSFPEYSDINRARELLAAVEQHDLLYSILDNATKVEFSITIGEENTDPKMKNCSVVTATYKVGDDVIGSFGVIGPTRMNYSKVLAVMGCMRQSISDIFAHISSDDTE